MTFFILDEVAEKLISAGKSRIAFQPYSDDCMVMVGHDPEAAIAYKQASILDYFNKSSLAMLEPILYGACCDRKESWSHQDIIVSKRK